MKKICIKILNLFKIRKKYMIIDPKIMNLAILLN